MDSRSVGPCERSCFVSSIAFSATSEAAPRYSLRSSSCVICWKFSKAPALLGFDSRAWTELFGSSCIASGLVVNTYGRHKVIFGTDFPVLDFERTQNEIEDLGLREESLRLFLRDNVVRIYGLDL